MGLDIPSLRPRIRAILTTPGTDLSTISAKRVRRQLIEEDHGLADFVKTNKTEIDLCISQIYEQVSNIDTEDAQSSSGDSFKRKHDGQEYGDDSDERPSPKKPAKKAKTDEDEAYARQLALELNGRTSRRGGNRPTTTKHKSSPKKKRKGISAATVNSDSESEGGSTVSRKSPEKKKKPRGGGGGGFSKEMNLSDPLAAVLQKDKLPRTQVVKQLWEYIKGNELQNPANKREILCDGPLRAVFNVDKIDMFKMNKVLGQHLRGPDE